MNYKSIISLVLRLVIAYAFIQWGIFKLMADPTALAGFIGGAFHNLGLTFLSQEIWVTVLWVWEILIGLWALLWLCTRTAMIAAIVILLWAMNVKWWAWGMIQLDIVYAVAAAILVYLWAGIYSLDYKFCKKDSCGCCKPGCTCGDCKACSKKNSDDWKEIIEA